ncbi:MAG: Do family serine endopeptidase [Gammaproteobacteria bacterium]
MAHLYRFLLASLIILAGLGYAVTSNAAIPVENTQNNTTTSPAPTLAPMLKQAMPAIVSISAQGPLPQEAVTDKDDMPQRKFEHIGSGVIVDAKRGLILTNDHLINKAQNITVILLDGRNLKAKLIGSDPDSDVAVLSIQANNLESLPLGDSDKLQVGDFVVAIGNPFGLNRFGPTSTATAGIISALQRSDLGIERYENFIQTDASINPGNSGGALVNLNGELIGINTAILAPSGGNVGIGFAIPINMAQNIMHQLIKYGSVQRGIMGILVQPLTEELAQAFDVSGTKGALVSKVNPNSPAEKAGLKAGDIIQKVNNQPITSASQVRNMVGLLRVGDTVHLQIMRDTRILNVSINIVDPKKHQETEIAKQPFIYGLALKQFSETSPFHGDIVGLQIIGITPNSPAWRAGLRPGDVIISAANKPVSQISELKNIAHQASGRLLVHVLRGSGALYFVIK